MLFDITCLTFDITLNTMYLPGDKEEEDWKNHKFQNSMKKNPPVVHESACNAVYQVSIPGSRRSLREGNGNPLQYSCQESPMDRGDWWATVQGIARVRHDLVTKTPL